MPTPHQNAPKLTRTSTFATVKDWVDAHKPGAGDTFISYIQALGERRGYGQVDLNSDTYGPPPNNKAVNWLAGWLLIGNLEPELGKLIAGGIAGAARDIPKELAAAGQGIGKLSPGSIWQDVVAQLTARSLWVRIAEGILGLALIIIGVARLGGTSAPVRTAAKAARFL